MPGIVKRVGIGAIIGLVTALLVGWITQLDGFFLKTMLNSYEYRSYDSRMKAKVWGVDEASIEDVVVVDIEQNSIEGLGNYYNWPHAYHGQLIDVLTSGNPKAVIFDIIFDPENPEKFNLVNALLNEHTPQDEELTAHAEQFLMSNDPEYFINSTSQSGKVYHTLVFEQADSSMFAYAMEAEPPGYQFDEHIILLPEKQAERLPTAERLTSLHIELLSSAKRTGSANFPQDMDGIIRRVPTAIYFKGPGHVYPSLAIAAAMDILGILNDGLDYDFENGILHLTDSLGNVIRKIPIDEQGRMYVNYYGPFKTFYYLPYLYCFDPEMLPPEYWENKIAVVGSSLPGLMDLRNTSVQETFPGVEIHANVIHSILNNEFVERSSDETNYIVILLFGTFLGTVVGIFKKPLFSLLIPIIAVVGWIIFAYSQFLGKLFMWEIVRPSITAGATYLGVFLYNFLVVEKDKRYLKKAFGTYIAPELIDEMYKNHQDPELGGSEGIHTAFFTDIQNFSTFSEKLTPTELVELLNDYLTEMTNILLHNKGTLDKYIGDSIVAFYGAPAPLENHEYLACLTAIKMQNQLSEFRKKWQEEGDRWPEIVHHMQTRIGISTGSMVTGNMGSNLRMNYTMMGDNVNIASRLESSAKQYGIYIQVAESTQKGVKDDFIWRELDFVRVKGKAKPVRVYELISEADNLPEKYNNILPAYKNALQFYQNQLWDQAIEAFKFSDTLEDMFPGRYTNPSQVYIKRCEYFKANPPEGGWDGVWKLTSK